MSEPVRPLRRNEIRQQNETLILQAAEKVFAEAGFGGALEAKLLMEQTPQT